MDGVSFDESRGYIDMYGWSGLFVEPIPEMFERLIKSYSGKSQESKNKYENSAITETNGPAQMIRIPTDIVDSGVVLPCFNGMSAIYPPKNGLGSEGDRATVEKYAELVTVQGITLDTLFAKHNITHVDFISIDAEGWDWKIIKQLKLNSIRPKLIRCEYINLEEDEKLAIKTFFESNDYTVEIHGQNIDAISNVIKHEVVSFFDGKNNSQIPAKQDDKPLTLVTALYDLGRELISPEFSREFSHYLECFKTLLETCHHISMVIYCDDSRVKELVAEVRDTKNTVIVHKNIENILPPPFIDKINIIRHNEEWFGQSAWLKNSPQCALNGYNILVMGKQFLLNDASILNHFNSDRFFWIDAGISNTCSPDYLKDPVIVKNILNETKKNKMLYLCYPYDGTIEVHGFEKNALNRYSGADTQYVARGGFFGGTKEAINRVNDVYYHTLNNSLNEGLMGTEESIFTVISYQYPDFVNCKFIEPNGLIYKFFEDLKHQNINQYDGTVLYFLTFNLPNQLEYCLKSFKEAHPDFFDTTKKYLLNNTNTDDTSILKHYKSLIDEYDLDEIKFENNVGICGARQYAAEHFDQTQYEFMIFFEDDMIMNTKDVNPNICKSGFNKFDERLFDKSISIMYENDLDYLKLTFSEFFGDNHDNWSWYNMSEEERQEWFYFGQDNFKKTKVDYTGTYRGLAYAVGEYHYCNWPLIFSRSGNKKIFLNNIVEHPFEQHWMNQTQKKIRKGEVKAGILLASPITHHRKYHYGSNLRKEN